jgi:hypothetical protein
MPTSLIVALVRRRQENLKFETSLGYIARLSQNKTKQKQKPIKAGELSVFLVQEKTDQWISVTQLSITISKFLR